MSKKFLSLLAVSTLALAACGGTTPTDDTTDDASSSVMIEDQPTDQPQAMMDGQVWTDADGTMLRYNADTRMLEGSIDSVTFVEVPGNMWKGFDENWYKFDDLGAVQRSSDEGQTWETVTSWESNGVSYMVENGMVRMVEGDASGIMLEGTEGVEDMGAAGETGDEIVE